ncbi:hypothetical protein AVEN_254465-1 [Araneus ventricosus]|uniref:Uncharacterized protein n=1 Tax=Araneus ventricosus TaxID=182803 RepID=A0A4Y2SB57_ARAVE|nr:hypothetical protein AVEN_254465-1 [Araneus ventricosus]
MTMSLNACVKRKHHPDFGSFVKVPPEERMANYPVVSPSKRADHTCGENSSPPPLDSEICHMPLTRDCDSVCHSPCKKVKKLLESDFFLLFMHVLNKPFHT